MSSKPTAGLAAELGANEASVLFAAGAVAGLAEGIAVQPLDLVKTRFQLSSTPNPSVLSALRAVVNEGGFGRLYRGILPELAGMIPKSSAMMASYDLARATLSAGGPMTREIAFAAGGISGVFEAVTVTPFQTVKVRLQSKEHLGRYRNTWDCVAKMASHEGPTALFRGLGATLWRNCAWNSVYFCSIREARMVLPPPKSKAGELIQTLLLGIGCGMFATLFNAPFDMAKSRVQGVVIDGFFSRPTLLVLADVFRSEGGLASCYKGFAPKALRMGLGGGVCVATYELIKSVAGVQDH